MNDKIIALQKKTNHRYRNKVIEKYQRRSGINNYNFKIIDPCSKPYQYLLGLDGQTVFKVNHFSSCLIFVDKEVIRIYIPLSRFPELEEAVLLVGQCLFTGNRIQRYLSLYKSYECICKNRNYEYSSIRHALSHPESILTHKKTIEYLKNIFGTTKIDLRNYKHLGVFYKYLGNLLIDNDKLLYEKLLSQKEIIRLPSEYKTILMDWEVDGI